VDAPVDTVGRVHPPEDPRAAMRCSHADRDAVAELLREAAGDGRLDIEELENRLEKAFEAKTYADLDALVVDLPRPATHRTHTQVAPAPRPVAVPTDLRVVAVLSDRKQEGPWIVPARLSAEAVLGSVKIDFTDATCPHEAVALDARAWLGNVVVVVPEGWAVRTDGITAVLGSVTNKVQGGFPPGRPIVYISGHSVLGDITVRHARTTRFLPR
jgi:hypothetical protein